MEYPTKNSVRMAFESRCHARGLYAPWEGRGEEGDVFDPNEDQEYVREAPPAPKKVKQSISLGAPAASQNRPGSNPGRRGKTAS